MRVPNFMYPVMFIFMGIYLLVSCASNIFDDAYISEKCKQQTTMSYDACKIEATK